MISVATAQSCNVLVKAQSADWLSGDQGLIKRYFTSGSLLLNAAVW